MDGIQTVIAVATAVLGTGGAGAALGRWFLAHVSKMDADRTKITERLLDTADRRSAKFDEELSKHRETDRAARETERVDFLKALDAHREALAHQEQECAKQREADRKLLAQVLAGARRGERSREDGEAA